MKNLIESYGTMVDSMNIFYRLPMDRMTIMESLTMKRLLK